MEDSNQLPAEPQAYSLDDINNMLMQGNKPATPDASVYTPIQPFVPASKAVAPAQPQVAPKAFSLEEVQAMFMQGNKPRQWTGNAAVDSFNDPDPLTEQQIIDRKAQLEYEKALGGKKDPTAKFRPKSTSVTNVRGSAVRGSASTGDEPTVGAWTSIGHSIMRSWLRGESEESANAISTAINDRAKHIVDIDKNIKLRDELIAKSKTDFIPNSQATIELYNGIINKKRQLVDEIGKGLASKFIAANTDAERLKAFSGKNEVQKQFDEAMRDPRNDFWDALKEGTDSDNFGGVVLNYLNLSANMAGESSYQMGEAVALSYATAGLGTYFKLAKSTKNVMSAVAIGTATGKDSFDANLAQNISQELTKLKINPSDFNAVSEFAIKNPEKWLKIFSNAHENAVRKGTAEGAVTALAAGVTGKIDTKFETLDRAKSLGAVIAGKELPKDGIGKAIAKGVGSMAGEMASEGIEEGTVQLATNLVDEKVDLKDTLAATFSGASAGGVSKGVMSAVGKAGKTIFKGKEATAEQKAMEAEVEAAKNKPVEESDQKVEASPAYPLWQKHGDNIPESEITDDLVKAQNEWMAKYGNTHMIDGTPMTADQIDQHLDSLELKQAAAIAVIKQNRVPPKPSIIHPIDRKNWEAKYGDTHYDTGIPIIDAAQVEAKIAEMKKAGWQSKRPRAIKKGQQQAQAQSNGNVSPRPKQSDFDTVAHPGDAVALYNAAVKDWDKKYGMTHREDGSPLTFNQQSSQAKPDQQAAPKADETQYTRDGEEISNDVIDPLSSSTEKWKWMDKYKNTHNEDGTPKSLEEIDKNLDFEEALKQVENENRGKDLSKSKLSELAFGLIRSGKFKSNRKRAKIVKPSEDRKLQASKIIELVQKLALKNSDAVPIEDIARKDERNKLYKNTFIKAARAENFDQLVKNIETLVAAGWHWSAEKQTLVNSDNQSETVQEALDRLNNPQQAQASAPAAENKPASEAKPAQETKPVETRTVEDMQDQLDSLVKAGRGDERQAERLRARIAAVKEAQAKPQPAAAQQAQTTEQPVAQAEETKVDIKKEKGKNPIVANGKKVILWGKGGIYLNNINLIIGYEYGSNGEKYINIDHFSRRNGITVRLVNNLESWYSQIKFKTNRSGGKIDKEYAIKNHERKAFDPIYKTLIKLGVIVPDKTSKYNFRLRDPVIGPDGNKYNIGDEITINGSEFHIDLITENGSNPIITLFTDTSLKSKDEEPQHYEIGLNELAEIIKQFQIKQFGKTFKQIEEEAKQEREKNTEPASDSMPKDDEPKNEDNADLVKKIGTKVVDPIKKNSILNKKFNGDVQSAKDYISDVERIIQTGKNKNGVKIELTIDQKVEAKKLAEELVEVGVYHPGNSFKFSLAERNENGVSVRLSTSRNWYGQHGEGEMFNINGYVYQIISVINEDNMTVRNVKTGECYTLNVEKYNKIIDELDAKIEERGWKYDLRPGYEMFYHRNSYALPDMENKKAYEPELSEEQKADKKRTDESNKKWDLKHINDASAKFEKEFGSDPQKITHKYILIYEIIKDIQNDGSYDDLSEKDLIKHYSKKGFGSSTISYGPIIDGKIYFPSYKLIKGGQVSIKFLGTTKTLSIKELVQEAIAYRDKVEKKSETKVNNKDEGKNDTKTEEPADITKAREQLKKLEKSGMTSLSSRHRDQAEALRQVIAKYEESVKPKNSVSKENVDTSKEDRLDEQRSEVSSISEAVTDTLTNIEGSKDLMKSLNGSKTKPGLIQKLEEQISAAEEAIDGGDQQALSDATETMSALLDELSGVRDELQDKHDNTPESLQDTDAYYAREAAIESLTEAIDTIESSISNLTDSINIEEDQSTAEEEMKKGEFNLSGEEATQVKDTAEDTTGDMIPDVREPAYVAQARTQLAKLEKSGKSPKQQETLRETIATYEASKNTNQEAAKPETQKPEKKSKKKAEKKPEEERVGPSTIDEIRARLQKNKYPKRPTDKRPETIYDDREAVVQYEEDRKLFNFDRSVDMSIVSTEALEDFEKLVKARSAEITSYADGEFTALAAMELERRQLETDDQVTSFGDIVADLRSLANQGLFLPTLPKEFNAEELEKFKPLFETNQFLFRNPQGMNIGKVNGADQKRYGTGKGKIVDRQHIVDMKNAADGMISAVAEALAGLGWTQLDPSNVGNFADVLAELIANNDEGVVPEGGVMGATRDMNNQYKRRYTPTEPETLSNLNQNPDAEADQEYNGDETMPDNPDDMTEDNGDNPFSMRDQRNENKPGKVSNNVIKKLESIADKPMTTTEAVDLIESLLKDEAIKNEDEFISVAQALDFLKTLSKSKIDQTTITFRKHYFSAMGQGVGIYDTKNKTIEISIPGVTYGYNEKLGKWENSFGSVLPTVTAHEVIHYHTNDALAKDRIYRKEVNRIFNAAKVLMADMNGDVKSEYGFTNVYEFLAEALTNKYFINLLKHMPSQGSNFDFSRGTDQNLFNELVAATKAMFARNGVNVDGTILEDIINAYAYAKASMKESGDANPLSMKDNPTAPDGQVANHSDADLASRGFISKYAKENMPEGMNLTLTFGMGPRRQGVKPNQISNYQGGMANGTLMNKGKVIATFEFDVESGSSEYDGGAILHWVEVTKSRRNLGLSKIMVAEIAERARRLGATTISATVLDPKQRPIASLKSVLGNVVETGGSTRADPLDESDFSYIDEYGDRVVSTTEVTSDIDHDKPLSLREIQENERKAAELDRRIKLNAANKYLGTLIGRRGYQGVIDRAVFEARKSGKLTEKEIQGLTSILNYIGSHFFKDLKLSIDKGDVNSNAMGQYDSAQKIIKIFKTAIESGIFLDTAAHEIAHHLTQFLPEADRVALRKEWKDARTKFLKANPGFASLVGNDDRNWANIKIKGTDLEAANKLFPDISKNKLFAQIPNSDPKAPIMYRIVATEELYRLFSSSEWFAETFKDTVMSRLNSDPAYTGTQKTWKDKLINLWENIKMKFRQMFGKDQAARILANFAKGRYDASKFQADNGTNVNAEGYDVKTEEDARTIAEVEAASNMPNMYVDEQNDANNEGFYNSIKDAEDNYEETVFVAPRNKETSVVKKAADFVVQVGSGISSRMHRYAKKNPNSPTVKKLANWIHNRAGTQSEAFERDIPTSIAVKRTYFINKFKDIMGPMRDQLDSFKNTKDKTAKQLREEVYKHLTDMITGRVAITQGPLGDAATQLKALLEEIRNYRVEAGEEIGFVEDYFPAIYNQDIIVNNRAQFVGDATAAYMIELNKLSETELAKELGLSKEEIETGDIFENADELEQKMTDLAQMKAIELYNSHVRGEASDIFDNMFSDRGGVNIENPALSRKFSRPAQDIMRKWQVNDPFRVVQRYIMGSVKRAELIRKFGMDNTVWKKMATQMEQDGVNYNVITDLAQMIRVATGSDKDDRSIGRRNTEQGLVDTMTLITAASAMGKGFWNNLAEPISIGIRSGSPIVGSLRAYAETWGVFIKLAAKDLTGRKEKGIFANSFWEEYGKDMGLIHNNLEDAWMTTHSIDAGGEESNPRMRWLTNAIYKANLMDASETAKQRASLSIGNSYIANLANLRQGNHWFNKLIKKLNLSDENWNPSQSVSDNLNELGIPPEKHDEFTKWVVSIQNLKGKALMNVITGNSEMARFHQEAIVRFSNQSSVKSNKAHKTITQNTFRGKVLLQLLSFAYSYAAEVSSRVWDMTRQAVLASPEGKRYNMVDRMRMLAPIMGAALSVVVYRGLLEFKDWLYDTEGARIRKKFPEWLKWFNALSYSGLLGPKIEQSVKIMGRDMTIGGPAGSVVANTGKAVTAGFKAGTGQGKGESAVKAARTAAAPIVKAGVVGLASSVNPGLGAAAVQVTNNPAFNNAIVGPKAEKSWFEKRN